MPCPPPGHITLEEVLITAELWRRPTREPNWQAENEALRSLTRQLVHDPEVMLQSLVDWAVELCDGTSTTAGVSLVETNPDGEEVFRWAALSGTLAHHVGGCTPRHFSPCGVCLEQGTAVLFSYPERYFTYFQDANTPLVEGLVLPLIAEGEALGTIWMITHDEQGQFDPEDVRLMTGLADFTAAALLQRQQHTQEGLTANTRLAAEVAERKRIETAIAADLQDTQLLHNLAARLITAGDIETLYQEILAAAIALTHAVAGSIQILDEATQDLVLTVIQGSTPAMAQHFHRVDASSQTSCGRALATGDRVFIDFDVPESEDPDGSMRMHVAAGFLSAQSTPLITRSGRAIGMVSTHWGTHHRPTERELRFLDLLARQAADLIEQRQAAAALSKSEQHYRTLFEAVDEGVCLFERLPLRPDGLRDYRYVAMNPAMQAMFGIPDLSGQSIRDHFPDEVEDWYDDYDRVLETGQALRFERETVPQGMVLEMFVTRVEDGSGKRLLAVMQNITARKRSEDQLRRAAERDAFRVKLSDGLRFLGDPADIEEMITRTAMEHFGADRCYYCEIEKGEAIIRRDAARDGLPPVAGVYPLSSFPILQAVIEAGHPFVVQDVRTTDTVDEDLRQICIQRQVISYINVPVMKDGQPVGALCLVQGTPRDWTDLEVELALETADRTWAAVERARTDAARRASEQRLSAIFAQAAVGLSELSLEGRFQRVNQALCQLLGRSRASLLAASIADVTHPDDLPHSLDTIARLLATGGSIALDKRYVRPDGRTVWANSIVTRLDDAAGAPQRFLVVTIDLSDRKQAEKNRDQLISEQAARYEAEQANRMKDEFLSMVSHELQSPLVAILGWTRLLRANPPTRQQLAHQLEIIERNATLQAKLIQDMLDISRIQVNKLNLALQPLELDPMIESAIATLQPKADEKNIKIDFRLPILDLGLGAASDYPKSKIQNPQLTVLGDGERLHQVFVNILTNATKFTPPLGQIIVTRSLIEVDKQFYAEVSITDTGMGIAADFLPYVFERFLQAEKSGSAGGLGLGLAIARHLVELHQGTIQVESPGLGQGATFTVRLPLVAEDECCA